MCKYVAVCNFCAIYFTIKTLLVNYCACTLEEFRISLHLHSSLSRLRNQYERLRGVFTTGRYTHSRLPLPYNKSWSRSRNPTETRTPGCNKCVNSLMKERKNDMLFHLWRHAQRCPASDQSVDSILYVHRKVCCGGCLEGNRLTELVVGMICVTVNTRLWAWCGVRAGRRVCK